MMKKEFIELLNIYGPSGHEQPVVDYLLPKLRDELGLENVFLDSYGNLLAEETYRSGLGPTILLSAHMDTVESVLEHREVLEDDNIIFSMDGGLGADDRAGIAIILHIIRQLETTNHPFDGTIKIAFTREEEIGSIGSYNMDKDWYEHVDLAIVVDRRGSRDIVIGNRQTIFCSQSVAKFMDGIGELAGMPDWECVQGGYSDAVTFATNGINTVNLSAGYYHEHTPIEYANLKEMNETAELILATLHFIQHEHHNFDKLYIAPKYKVEPVEETAETEIYHLDEGDVVIRQGTNEVYLSQENIKHLTEGDA